jgi:hypothetical protein
MERQLEYTVNNWLIENDAANVRRVMEHGREYLVAPLSLINPGVLPGSRGPLMYTPEDTKLATSAWNGMPITVYHPESSDGSHVSAGSPGILDKQGVGWIRNATFDGKLRAEGWFDTQKTRQVDKRVYDAIINGKSVELSTGLFTDNDDAPPNASHNGVPFSHYARNHKPDHVAILPDQTGACGVSDGCGINVNKSSNQPQPPTQNGRDNRERVAKGEYVGDCPECGTMDHNGLKCNRCRATLAENDSAPDSAAPSSTAPSAATPIQSPTNPSKKPQKPTKSAASGSAEAASRTSAYKDMNPGVTLAAPIQTHSMPIQNSNPEGHNQYTGRDSSLLGGASESEIIPSSAGKEWVKPGSDRDKYAGGASPEKIGDFNTRIATAELEGIKDHLAGKKHSDNHYPPGSVESRAWEMGRGHMADLDSLSSTGKPFSKKWQSETYNSITQNDGGIEHLEEIMGVDLDGDHEEGENPAHKKKVMGHNCGCGSKCSECMAKNAVAAYQRYVRTLNANPEGYNQYTKGLKGDDLKKEVHKYIKDHDGVTSVEAGVSSATTLRDMHRDLGHKMLGEGKGPVIKAVKDLIASGHLKMEKDGWMGSKVSTTSKRTSENTKNSTINSRRMLVTNRSRPAAVAFLSNPNNFASRTKRMLAINAFERDTGGRFTAAEEEALGISDPKDEEHQKEAEKERIAKAKGSKRQAYSADEGDKKVAANQLSANEWSEAAREASAAARAKSGLAHRTPGAGDKAATMGSKAATGKEHLAAMDLHQTAKMEARSNGNEGAEKSHDQSVMAHMKAAQELGAIRNARSIWNKMFDFLTGNAARRHPHTGQFIPPDAGTGKGPAHDAAVAAARRRNDADPDDDDDDDDDEHTPLDNDSGGVPSPPPPTGQTNVPIASNQRRRLWIAYNRDWPQKKRDDLDPEDFAGPDQSFPIKTQEDLDAACQSLGRASDPETVKSGIRRIAKKKGLKLPDTDTWNAKSNQASDSTAESRGVGSGSKNFTGTDVDPLRRGKQQIDYMDADGHDSDGSRSNFDVDHASLEDSEDDDDLVPGRSDNPKMPGKKSIKNSRRVAMARNHQSTRNAGTVSAGMTGPRSGGVGGGSAVGTGTATTTSVPAGGFSQGGSGGEAGGMTPSGPALGGTSETATYNDDEDTCPECGGDMEDGKCEECGYEADDDDDNDVENRRMTGNAFPQVPQHDASMQAAGASVMTQHPEARERGLQASDASGEGDSAEAADQHVATAKIHDRAATQLRKTGDDDGAADHDNAAMMHRKAASMHKANPMDQDDVQNVRRVMAANEHVGHYFGDKADIGSGDSAAAEKASHRANQTKSPKDNATAAGLHGKAKAIHERAGNKEKAEYHGKMAAKHGDRAVSFDGRKTSFNLRSSAGGSAAGTNNLGGTNMDRNQTIQYIVANSRGVWDKKSLIGLPDANLGSIARGIADSVVANSARGGFTIPEGKIQPGKYVYNSEGKLVLNDGGPAAADVDGGGKPPSKDANDGKGSNDVDGEDGEENGNMFASRRGKGLTGGGIKMLTNEQWMQAAPPAIREIVSNGLRAQAAHRTQLIERLTSNARDQNHRSRLVANFQKMATPVLEDLVSAMPVPVENSFLDAPQTDGDLNFLGSAGGPLFNTDNASDDSRGQDLSIPTLNYAEMAKEQEEARRAKRQLA